MIIYSTIKEPRFTSRLVKNSISKNLELKIHTNYTVVFVDKNNYSKMPDFVREGINLKRKPNNQVDLQPIKNKSEILNKFHSIVLDAFDKKFTLIPINTWKYTESNGIEEYSPNVFCRLSLSHVESGETLRVYVYKPKVYEDTKAGFFSNFRFSGNHRFNGMLLKDRSVINTKTVLETMQTQVIHEFGHYLGLSHISGSDGNKSSYGKTARQREDIMGGGNQLNLWHSYPWFKSLRRHLKDKRSMKEFRKDFAVTTRRVKPRKRVVKI